MGWGFYRQHVVFSIGRLLDLLVPDIPESVEIKVKREYYLAKQALAENEVSTRAIPYALSGYMINHGPSFPPIQSWQHSYRVGEGLRGFIVMSIQ